MDYFAGGVARGSNFTPAALSGKASATGTLSRRLDIGSRPSRALTLDGIAQGD